MAIISFTNYKRGQTPGSMRAVMHYTIQEKKTLWQGQQLVTGINCRPDTAFGDFLTTKNLYHKMDGVQFYHMVQSFPKGETVDPVAAHKAALELAKWFDGREVLVSTHVDRDHIHSHLLINSVSLADGKKLHIANQELVSLRQRNDAVCDQMGLPSHVVATKKVKGIGAREYHAAYRGESWKTALAIAIDNCMRYAESREEFILLMESEGYLVRWEPSRKYITYTCGEDRRCRDNKLHEEKYLKENMAYEFTQRQVILGRAETALDHESDEDAGCGTASDTDREELERSDRADTAKLKAGGSQRSDPANPDDSGRYGHQTPADGAAVTGTSEGTALPDERVRRTGWEPERAVFLQLRHAGEELAAGSYEYEGAGEGGDGLSGGQGERSHEFHERAVPQEHPQHRYSDRQLRWLGRCALRLGIDLASLINGDGNHKKDDDAENLAVMMGVTAAVIYEMAALYIAQHPSPEPTMHM